MMPGLFDLPAPLLQWIDDRMTTFMPATVSVAVWAVIGAIVCLEIYRVVSPQKKIGQIRHDAKEAQRALSGFDGEFEDAWPLMKRMLSLSLKRIGIVLPATLIGAYPVLVLIVWLGNSYGHRFPTADEAVTIDVPSPLEGRWVNGVAPEQPRVQALGANGSVILEIPMAAAVTVLHKRIWWNWLLANPAGYLPADSPVEEIRVHLPDREFVSTGPSWMRGWEIVFIPVLFVVALAYKSARKID